MVVFGAASEVTEKVNVAAAARTMRPSLTVPKALRSDDGEEAVERLALVERAPVREAAANHRGGEEVPPPAGLERLGLLPEDREIVDIAALVDDGEANVVA